MGETRRYKGAQSRQLIQGSIETLQANTQHQAVQFDDFNIRQLHFLRSSLTFT